MFEMFEYATIHLHEMLDHLDLTEHPKCWEPTKFGPRKGNERGMRMPPKRHGKRKRRRK